ncbi:GHKL domain-containing protein [Peribacillus cavernae]|uniref:histidine kinase n=1 Tax=Peribacillus cavernae TaxID=1674310 RepID=A0A433HQB2_9BACI|nr:histidine kinase N-terminal domain-containing protein [Peribacillus cavernae]MDQ0216964.1 signal transduction histidine kinase [Peribacillus cavernae]RUQ30546.1 GHKL domain-containing protein [Peribacillus cavernae]
MVTAQLLADYLDKRFPAFFQDWQDSLFVSSDDIHFNRINGNGAEMYYLVKLNMVKPLSIEEIMNLAYKVAKERAEADINIGHFVYNVNKGRTLIIKHLNSSGFLLEDLDPYIEGTNNLFDQFCFYAVTKYTELKIQELHRKDSFIQQTHKDRLFFLGQMSSSFVHEFRNPLTSVIGFTKLLKNEIPNHKYIKIIERELEQLNYKITQFLHVSKKDILRKEKEDVFFSELFNEILDFLYPSIVDSDVEIIKDFEYTEKFEANKEELRQVFINIILNSIEALKQKETQRTITIHFHENDETVTIKISNNGPNISREMMEMIFEPFYTTKELGTGIGLYVCKQIIDKHNGKISCTSGEDFTSFIISLPKTAISHKPDPAASMLAKT